MGQGITQSDKPIVTNGIATCMGIGFTKDGINYFSHASPYELDTERFINSWKDLFLNKQPKEIYLIRIGFSEKDIKFLRMLDEIGMLENVVKIIPRIYIIQQYQYYNNKIRNYKLNQKQIFLSEHITNFKMGIRHSGVFSFLLNMAENTNISNGNSDASDNNNEFQPQKPSYASYASYANVVKGKQLPLPQ